MEDEVTEKIIGIAYEVINELGVGFLESVYEGALCLALQQVGLQVECQVNLEVMFRGAVVGKYVADVIVNGAVLVELKAVRSLLPEHQAQVINYLKATKIKTGLLINFGNRKLEIKRLYG